MTRDLFGICPGLEAGEVFYRAAGVRNFNL